MERLIHDIAANLITSAVKKCRHAPATTDALICRPCMEMLVEGFLAAAPENRN